MNVLQSSSVLPVRVVSTQALAYTNCADTLGYATGEDLPVHTYFLESEHCGSNGWPTIVIPSATAPGLAPRGHHVLHATITEDFEPWKALARGSREYNARKEQRAEILWDFVRQVRPQGACITPAAELSPWHVCDHTLLNEFPKDRHTAA